MTRLARCPHPATSLVPRHQADTEAGPITVYDCTACGSTGAWWPRSMAGGGRADRMLESAEVVHA